MNTSTADVAVDGEGPVGEKKARLIAFEGTDGAGKTTAAVRLVAQLRAAGQSVSWHPNRTFRPVRQALNRLAEQEGHRDRFELFGPDFAQLVPSVFKWRELLALTPALSRPDHWVVVDRYKYAHLALAEVFGTGNQPLLRRLFAAHPEPDLVFFLDVEAGTAAERVLRRGDDSNRVGFLDDFRRAFRNLDEFASFRVVDASQPADAVFAQVWEQVRAAVPELGRTPA